MNAFMNITVRVNAAQARAALRSVQGQLRGVQATSAAAGGGFFAGLGPAGQSLGKLNSVFGNLTKWGKNFQWVGRQLEYNFTLPIGLAAAASTKWALDNERAQTRVRKVYGDLNMSQKQVREETNALNRSFELLSNRFGVAQSEVIGIGAAWAQAGAAGAGLARSTRLTMEAMVLGEMDAAEATEGLIAVQSAYRLNSVQLREELAKLNIIENQTGISFEGLIDVVTRAGGSARNAGVDLRHLGAFAAALVPATGSAATAGNALRTIISRVVAPTQDTIDVLREMGIEVTSGDWTNKNAVERIELMASRFQDLSQSQQNVVSSVVASRWQVSRFNVLMADIGSEAGYYAKALDATSDSTRNLAVYQRELNTVLASNPQAFKILVTQLQNALTKAFIPLMPAILAVLGRFTELVNKFNELDPATQQLILLGLVALAAVGPVVRYFGALNTLLGVFGTALLHVGGAIVWLIGQSATLVGWFVGGKFLAALELIWIRLGLMGISLRGIGASAATGFKVMGGWVISAMAWVGGLVLRIPLIGAALQAIGPAAAAAFSAVGTAIMGALGAVAAALGISVGALVAIIVAAVVAVIAGVILVLRTDVEEPVIRFVQRLAGWLGQLPRIVADAFMAVARVIQRIMQQIIDWLSYLNPFARHSPSLVESVVSGTDIIMSQYSRLGGISAILDRAKRAHHGFLAATAGSGFNADQYEVDKDVMELTAGGMGSAVPQYRLMAAAVRELKSLLPGLTAAIDAQEDVVDRLQQRVDSLNDRLQDAKERVSDLANTPITGMRAMSDAIFANEMAQKRLRLEILKLEEAGQSIEDTRDKLGSLESKIEEMTAERTSLRMAGAGSDILGFYDDQIAQLERAYSELEAQGDPAEKLRDELEKLQRAGERLELENAIKFDEQLRQIDQMANGLNELPFDTIMRKLRVQTGVVAETERAHASANAELTRQKSILDDMQGTYDAITDQIQDMESAMTDFTSAARAAKDAAAAPAGEDLSTAQELFRAGGDYDLPAGDSIIGPEGGLADIEDFNKMLEDELADLSETFGNFDIFKPIKDQWHRLQDWFGEQVLGPFLLEPFNDAWGFVKRNFSFEGLGNIFGDIGDALGTAFGAIGDTLSRVWNGIIWPILSGIAGFIGAILIPVWRALGAAVSWVWNVVILPAIRAAWVVIEPIFNFLVAFITGYVVPVFQLLAAIVEIVFTLIGRAIMWVWETIIVPVFGWLIQHAMAILPMAFNFLLAVIGIVWTVISTIITFAWENVIRPIFQAIGWVLENVVGPVFNWLWHQVIEPVWNGIGAAISWVMDNVISPIFSGIDWVLHHVVGPAFEWLRDEVIEPVWNGIERIIRDTWNTIAGIIEGGVNFGIDAFNLLARAVRAVAGAVNVDVNINDMEHIEVPRLAVGGTIPFEETGRGGLYNRARAIVGEGSKAWPEFVIPTDPKHRGNATRLLSQAARMINGNQYVDRETGGWGPIGAAIERGKEFVKDVVGTVAKGALQALYAPISGLANAAIDRIPVRLVRDTVRGMKDMVDDWVKGGEEGLPAGVLPPGGNIIDRLRSFLASTGIPHRVTSTLRPGSITASGNLSLHALGRAVDFAGPTPGVDTEALANIFRAFKPIEAQLAELIYAGPQVSYNIKHGRQVPKYAQAQHHDHVHAALAAGGLVALHGRGMNLQVAEGGFDEKVQVLPLRDTGQEGGTTLIFEGDLVFPNITDGDDARTLIDNLKALAD